ncbi:TetR/AcrR family transcriptional regulator [Marinomonas shanghaiensis]|uniref:TetR/AcrR family transcriptional regulator n=1 Tax=Marinomonas shanghaiensis TaxID=2202418 RepID=UPI003A8EAE2F
MLGLRERRRIEMARDIHKATLKLACQDGFSAVTTQAISKHVGISHRTFFNYYENKESALMSGVPEISEESIERFLKSELPIKENLRLLMSDFMQAATSNREELLIVLEIVRTHPKAGQIQLARMSEARSHLSELLAMKIENNSPLVLDILAEVLLFSGWTGILRWLKESIELQEAFDESWEALGKVTKILTD